MAHTNRSPTKFLAMKACTSVTMLFIYAAVFASTKTILVTSPSSYTPQKTQINVPVNAAPGTVLHKIVVNIDYELFYHKARQRNSNGSPNYLHSFFGEHSFSCRGTIKGVSGVKWRMSFSGNAKQVSCGTSGIPVATNACDSQTCVATSEMVIELYRTNRDFSTNGPIKFPNIRFSGPRRWLGTSGEGFELKASSLSVDLTRQLKKQITLTAID